MLTKLQIWQGSLETVHLHPIWHWGGSTKAGGFTFKMAHSHGRHVASCCWLEARPGCQFLSMWASPWADLISPQHLATFKNEHPKGTGSMCLAFLWPSLWSPTVTSTILSRQSQRPNQFQEGEHTDPPLHGRNVRVPCEEYLKWEVLLQPNLENIVCHHPQTFLLDCEFQSDFILPRVWDPQA